MSHFPYSLCPSFSEEDPGSHFDKLRILDESKYRHGLTTPTYYLFLLPEHDAGLVAALHPLDRVYPLYDGCLPDVAYMHCGSEPSQYLCRVEEDAHISLEIHTCRQYSIGRYFFKDLLRYPMAREGVYGPGRHAFLAHTKKKVINIVGLRPYG